MEANRGLKRRLTPSEKMMRYRERLQKDPVRCVAAKQIDRERKALFRKSQKDKEMALSKREQEKLADERRMMERTRKREYRLKLAQTKGRDAENELPATPTKVYSSKQAAGKAMQRLRVKLPFSPRKRRAVTLKLALEAGNELQTPKRTRQVLTQETEMQVISYYSRDDISWAAPGMKDSQVVKGSSGEKDIKQKRYLTMNVMEAFQLFKSENPDANIGKSKFFELRPKHIQPMANIPHNVCICKQHGNMDSLLEGITKVKGQSCPRTGRELIDKLVCQRDNPSCMMNKCMDCSNTQLAIDEEEVEDSVKWRKWTESEGRPIQVEVLISVEDAVAEVNGMMRDYKYHCLVKDQQSKLFRQCKESISEGEAVVQIDFAENYAAVTQDEVQSAHWSHSQITIFTAVAWFSNGCKSFAVVSDDLNHDKVAVWAMLRAVVGYLKKEHSITHVKFFSDGCAAQFKNRYTLMNLCFMEEDYGVTGTWAFFASSHGKGSVDAVGGTVKRSVWRMVKSRREIVKDAATFYKVASEQCARIQILLVPSTELRSQSSMLEGRWKDVLPITGIQKMHIFEPVPKSITLNVGHFATEHPRLKFKMSLQSKEQELPADPEPELPGLSIGVGEWVLVKYDEGLYPGEVREVGEKEVKVSAMVKSGKFYKWPASEDCIFYPIDNVVKKLQPPTVKSARGTFEFLEKW